MTELLVLGASHKTAPLAVRERLALLDGQVEPFLRELMARPGITEAVVLSTTGGAMPGSMRMTFLISLVAMVCLFVTLWKYELASKHATFRLRALKRKLAGDEELWAPNPRRSAAPTL